MAKSTAVNLRVGILIAAALGLICFGIFSIGRGVGFFGPVRVIQARFQSINGLQSGAPVTLSGVRIGTVEGVQFPPEPSADYVIVNLRIDNSALPRIHSDAVAHISTMGLLGDKYIDLTGGTIGAPPMAPGQLLQAENPVDYQAMLQKAGTGDLMSNLIGISQSLRSLLATINSGHGLMSQLVNGENGPRNLQLKDIHDALDNLSGLAADMDGIAHQVNRGQGILGAMVSNKIDGQKLFTDISSAANSMDKASNKLNLLLDKFNSSDGVVQRLIDDPRYAREILNNLQISLANLKDILQKVNSGKGSVGLAVNDPILYRRASDFLGENGSTAWGLKLLNHMYNVTHPFGDAARQGARENSSRENLEVQPTLETPESKPPDNNPSAQPASHQIPSSTGSNQ